jgi:hypothetical protein
MPNKKSIAKINLDLSVHMMYIKGIREMNQLSSKEFQMIKMLLIKHNFGRVLYIKILGYRFFAGRRCIGYNKPRSNWPTVIWGELEI